jgi:hypothetical protein
MGVHFLGRLKQLDLGGLPGLPSIELLVAAGPTLEEVAITNPIAARLTATQPRMSAHSAKRTEAPRVPCIAGYWVPAVMAGRC